MKMRNNMLNCVLLVMLVWARQSSQYSCENANGCYCTSDNTNLDKYTIGCPSGSPNLFRVDITSEISGSVTCNEMATWSDLEISSTNEAEDVTGFSFEQCSLPDSSLHEITRRIGVQPKDRLAFESHSDLSSTLKRRHLSGFPKIKQLSLKHNGLTELPSDLLTDLPEITLLDLDENRVILSPEIFIAVPKLQRLELGNNKWTRIDPVQLFQSLKNLEFLSLWKNELTDLGEDVFKKLTALSTLEISYNNLTTLLPEVIRPLGNLSRLYMSGNCFSTLPEDLLSRNLNLTAICLDYNRGNLRTLPHRFLSNLSKLEDVSFKSDQLEVLPEDIFWGSSALTEITLTGNLLSTLPMNIFKDSKNLKSLDLSSNRLSDLPDGIFKSLTSLEKLDLQRNSFATIPRKLFSDLTGLLELNLEFNGLTTIASDSFSHLKSLQIARLSHNQLVLREDRTASDVFYKMSIEVPNQWPFSNCKNLTELHLAFNNITEIFDDWTFDLNHLRILDLEYNQISILDARNFQFQSRNMEVNIKHNNISRIDLEEAKMIADSQDSSNNLDSKNVRILIQENPIICDCHLYHFLEYLEMDPKVPKMFHIVADNLRCAGPGRMQNILVSKLKSTTMRCAFPNCPKECKCWFREYDYTVIADCSHRSLTTAPERISYDRGNIVLDLTDNLLTELPYINQSGYGNITKLLLSHNNISRVSRDNIPMTLKVLELHNNNLTRLDAGVLKRFEESASLENITLGENPWECDCGARDLLSFVQSRFTKIRNFTNIICYSNTQPMWNMTVTDLCPAATGTIVGMSLGVTLLGLSVGMLAALYYKYQTEIRIWLYGHPKVARFAPCLIPAPEESDKDKLYDAFISYSHKDEDFVVNELVPQLEEGPKRFKLCLHFRDWTAGEWIPTQIARSVEDSRRTIVILSPNFLESVWGRMEFRAAHSQALSEGRARVIVVLFGDVGPTDDLDPELKAYLSMNTYIKWGDPWFWERLRYALPRPPKVQQNNAKKIFENHQHHIQIIGDKNGLIHPPGYPTTPPAVTTPPADTLKTFTCDGSLSEEVLITDCLKNAMHNSLNNLATKIDFITPADKADYENNMIN